MYLKQFAPAPLFQPASDLDAIALGRYRLEPMRTRWLLSALCVAVLSAGCTRPPAGVLTLAPAGMRTTGACTAKVDGTLTMTGAATAESVAYVDAGPVTITVTAQSLSAEAPAPMELWFDGAKVGSFQVSAAAPNAFPFHVDARDSGPTALRINLAAANNSPAAVLLQKIVITEP